MIHNILKLLAKGRYAEAIKLNKQLSPKLDIQLMRYECQQWYGRFVSSEQAIEEEWRNFNNWEENPIEEFLKKYLK